jgi:hypothetical protein
LISKSFTGDNSFDILQRHHIRNRLPHTPDANCLRQSAGQHNTESVMSDEESRTNNDNDASDFSLIEELVHKHAKQHSKTPYSNVGKPTQLKFYRGKWVKILELAKQFFQLHIATECAFPNRETQFQAASDCLRKSIERHAEEKAEEGMFDHLSYLHDDGL